jgi:Bacterial mobilisation protein (MobC)
VTANDRRPAPSAAKGAARRKRAEGGRHREVELHFTDDEYEMLAARAAEERVTIQRYIVSRAMARKLTINTALTAELTALRRLVANLANNVNQIARNLNSGGKPDASLTAVTSALGRTLIRLDTAVSWLGAPPPPRSGTRPERDGP